MTKNHPYLDEKVMTIKIVTEMTGLSERQVRYYDVFSGNIFSFC
ncbi:hypothetical protein [Priestia megaterium]|nr:hypothetical protein [Priestia megaterium]